MIGWGHKFLFFSLAELALFALLVWPARAQSTNVTPSVPAQAQRDDPGGSAAIYYRIKSGDYLLKILREQLNINDESQLAQYAGQMSQINPGRQNWDRLQENELIRLPAIAHRQENAAAGSMDPPTPPADVVIAQSPPASPQRTIELSAAAPAASSTVAVAQTPQPQTDPAKLLTLDDALLIALANHPNLSAARARIYAQQSVVGQQMAAYFPTLTMTDRYQTGTQSGGSNIAANGSDFFSVQFSSTMTLYNFGKREGAVQAARETLSAQGHNFKTTADAVVLGVKTAYYAYLQARAIVGVREETVKSRDLLVKQARGFFEVGTRARIDVAQAERDYFNALADEITARNAVQVAWVTLKNALGLRELSERPLVEEAIVTDIRYSLVEARELAYKTRPELKSFEAQLKAQDQNIAVARRGHLPDLNFDGNYARRHVSNETANGRTINTFPLQPSWQVQLTLSVPIFDGLRTTNRVDETLHTYSVIKAQEEQQRQQVALDVEQSYLRLVELRERIKANEAAARAARENLDLARGRYEVGVGSIIEVSNAQVGYADAQTTYVRALYDYKIADAQFTRAIGL